MSKQRCMKNGKRGWKWGKDGTCHVGPGALALALQDGRRKAAKKGKMSGR